MATLDAGGAMEPPRGADAETSAAVIKANSDVGYDTGGLKRQSALRGPRARRHPRL
jgi:hypothetical protein